MLLGAASVPVLDTHRIAVERSGNDAPLVRAAHFFLESADQTLDGASGFISTEFLDDVSWRVEPGQPQRRDRLLSAVARLAAVNCWLLPLTSLRLDRAAISTWRPK